MIVQTDNILKVFELYDGSDNVWGALKTLHS